MTPDRERHRVKFTVDRGACHVRCICGWSAMSWGGMTDPKALATEHMMRQRPPIQAQDIAFEDVEPAGMPVSQSAGHDDVNCDLCGSMFRKTVMHEIEDGVGAHSEDFHTVQICPYYCDIG